MSRRSVVVLVIVAVLVGGAIARNAGKDSGDAASRTTEPCIVLANGNELCGGNAAAYCTGFLEGEEVNFQTRSACESVGVKLGAEDEPTDPSPGDDDNDGVPNARDPAPDDASVRSTSEPVRFILEGVEKGSSVSESYYLVEPTTSAAVSINGTVDPTGADVAILPGSKGTARVQGEEVTLDLRGLKEGTNVVQIRGSSTGRRATTIRLEIDRR